MEEDSDIAETVSLAAFSGVSTTWADSESAIRPNESEWRAEETPEAESG